MGSTSFRWAISSSEVESLDGFFALIALCSAVCLIGDTLVYAEADAVNANAIKAIMAELGY